MAWERESFMLAAINKLREIRERCREGEPLDLSVSCWLAERLDRYLDHECTSVDDALGLRQPRGGMPWWLVEAVYERNAALSGLAELIAADCSPSAQAREVRRLTLRYGASAWRHDRDREAMPGSYRGTAREYLWIAFKSGAPIPLGERQLRKILGG